MKPQFFKVPGSEESVRVELWDMNEFYDPLHYHEECQITLIQKSKGSLFAGDSLVEFAEGDLFFIGENLPHVFKSDKEVQHGEHVKAISVFFSKPEILHVLNTIPEANLQIALMNASDFGLQHKHSQNKELEMLINGIYSSTRFSRVLQLLNLIDLLANSPNTKQISTQKLITPSKNQRKKLDVVFEYIMQNYNKNIRLVDLSSLIHMTPVSFSRFFKSHTLKTFSSFLIEVRIKKACTMLIDDGVSVSDACYSSGYNNLSVFHRHFQRVVGFSPGNYKKKYATRISKS